MTEVISRAPLQSLSMAAAQRTTRRRSSQTAADGAEGPPVKRQRTEVADTSGAIAKQTNGRKAAGSKAAYTEEVDGFSFAKKPKSQPKQAKASASSEAAAPKQDTRNQQSPNRLSQQHNTSAEGTVPPKRRRSARLSGDKVTKEDASVNDTKSTAQLQPKRTSRGRDRTRPSPSAPSTVQNGRVAAVPKGNVQVEKTSMSKRIPLPFGETPIISKNREMRQTSGQGRRRSSSLLRGRRASSLIESGASNAVPHKEVETADFYKHITEDLPEPRRMKQLMVWCGERALTDRPGGGGFEDANAVNAKLAARAIQDELLKDFASRSEMSDWFNREDLPPEILVKKPNPKNKQNAAKLIELEAQLQRLTADKQKWGKLLQDLEAKATAAESSVSADMKLRDPEQAASYSLLESSSNLAETVPTRVKKATRSLEFSIDTVADGVHSIREFKIAAEDTSNQIAKSASDTVKQRQSGLEARNSTEKAGVGDLLRAFSRAAH